MLRSFAVTASSDTLAAFCVTVLRSQLEAGDTLRCAEVLAVALKCDTPVLTALQRPAHECACRHRSAVAAHCSVLGVSPSDMDAVLASFAQTDQRTQSAIEY